MKDSRELPQKKLSEAHRKSRFAIIDPTYSADSSGNNDVPLYTWLYGNAELECWRLQVLRERTERAELKVHYPGKYHRPFASAYFRLALNSFSRDIISINFYSNSTVSILIDKDAIYKSDKRDAIHKVLFDKPGNGQYIIFELKSAGQEPPCLSVPEGEAETESALWEWSHNGLNWSKPKAFTSSSEKQYPHCLELQETVLSPLLKEGQAYDFGCEILGKINIISKHKPEIFVGESLAEAMNRHKEQMEQSTEIIKTGTDSWQSRHQLAFRYLTIDGLPEGPETVTCSFSYHPVSYKGAFAASDKTLTRIWMNSAYTLHLCMHDFFIDGIKRDRLPWTGDLAVSLLANAYSFRDEELIRRTLTALGRSGIRETHINGIIDYSLWWIIVHDLFQLYYCDIDFLQREWPGIEDSLSFLLKNCDARGFLQTGGAWLFIDWVEVDKFTALQILWWWALDSGVKLANRLGRGETASQWLDSKSSLEENLKNDSWDGSRKLWKSSRNPDAEYSRHANILSVISGLTNIDDGSEIRRSLLDNELCSVGTPYMKGFECLAVSLLGADSEAVGTIRSYWGGMMEKGATTFWEAYDPGESDAESYAFYKRPFARSLCHAWGAGPCALLPRILLGIRPLSDGWKEWTCSPVAESLEWVCATVPFPGGETAEVNVSKSAVNITVPRGTTLVTESGRFSGPVQLKADRTNQLVYRELR